MKSLTLFFVIMFSSFVLSQMTENSTKNIPLDINTKAQELGITPEQLNGILSSVENNGEGDPQPDAMQENFFTGQAAGDQFGYSVASAGDLNGDGYDDIIIGAPFNSSARGKAYLYFGGMVPDYVPDVIFSGIYAGSQFGFSVSSAGDVNADGFDDIIIGAPIDAGTPGLAYIVFGNSTMSTYSVLNIFNPYANYDDYFGISVSGVGDLNGDGYSDVVVGAPYSDFFGTDMGAAFVYYGGSAMDATPDLFLAPDGSGSSDEFGRYVSKAGDVNGDGFGDVFACAPGTGMVSIYFGGVSMNNIADYTFGGILGTYAGDVNGDGYDDFMIGYNPAVYIFLGGATLDVTVDVVLSGAAVLDQFGASISAAGDVNGDGYSDVIVGASANDAGGTDAGRAYVYFGGVVMDNVKDIMLTGKSDFDYFGYSVSTAGDINGDGYVDIVVGAPFNDAGGNNAGRAYLYTNSLTGVDIPDEIFTGETITDNFGYSVSTAGDVNGDGYSDVIVSAYNFTYTELTNIFYGGASMDNTADITISGFGSSVSTAGDVNGDGYSDVIVGADWYSSQTGRAYIYYGGSSMDNVPDVIMTGEAANSDFGGSVSTAGDVNGDGYSDVIVGAWGYNSNTGRAYIYFGGSLMNDVADVTMTGEAATNYFGYSVSTAGDVNGDGYSDVIVGADRYSSQTGRAYIYFGSSSMNNVADVIMTGEAADNFFGHSVSTAGDVNSDGYSDVIVGVHGYSSYTGRAYIYYGGYSMNNVADVIMAGEATNIEFGWSVSTAGDINGDGYSDVIVGAMGYNSVTGQAYIYSGGISMDNVADVIMTGEAEWNKFGNSVSTAGDINGDGYSDVIIGAPWFSPIGRAYLYLSSSPPIKPPLKSVKDITFDQGGFVRVRWNRSGYDIPGFNKIADYILQRSDPPGTSGFVWDYIVTVPAIKASEYSYVSPTPYDSMTNTSGTFYFRVIARGTNPEEMWYSNILYGHSVDNLTPLPPFNFYATLQTSQVKLGWKANTEEDFKNYKIYRSDTPVSDAFTLLTTTTDTTFADTSPLTGNAYYYISAYDIHDNGSQYSSDSIMAYLSANIKVLLEGSYDAGGVMRTSLNLAGYIPLSQPFNTSPWNYTGTESVTAVPANVTDWILVELRSTTTTVVDRRAAFIKNDGTLVDLDGVSNIKFPTATAGNYYVVITHRNHLSVMTANPITISFNPTLYDMRTDQTKAYGTNAMKSLGGGYYGAYTADTDGSRTVNAADRSNTWNQRNLSGYYGTDVDLSGTVNAGDRSSVWNNRNISSQVPTPVDGPITEIVKENNQ